jgi:DNA invertase Pin-like site-specific DNA recombinase
MQSKSNPTPLRLIAYVRVSTNGQTIKGDSPAAQEEACRAWAQAQDHEIIGVTSDNGLSGTLDADDRPGLTSALLDIAEGEADGLVIRELDRLARELHVQEAVLSRVWAAGGHVFEVAHGEVLQDDPDDPMRTFLRQVMGAAAQLEAGMIRMRMRRGRRRRARQGHYIGGPRLHRKYGFALTASDGRFRYKPVPDEQQVIGRIRTERSNGQTLRAIAGILNSEDIAPPSGRCWYPATVRLIAERAVA